MLLKPKRRANTSRIATQVKSKLQADHNSNRCPVILPWSGQLLFLHMTGNQFGHFKHADLLLAVEHGLQILVGIDQGLLFGVL
jgi:hypothetical protein